jgi:[lysine-biosynthesis-protein LysW]---L-2-aminoadipate ligase
VKQEKNIESSLTILYDTVRWEEKALYEAAKKRGIKVNRIDCKSLSIDLNQAEESPYKDTVIIQRCVSYFKSIHSTAALEGLGAKIINSLHTATSCGNKLFTHMELQKAGIKTPRAISAFSEESAIAGLGDLGYPAVIKPTIGSWGRLVALVRDKDAAKAVVEDRMHMFPLYQIYYLEEFVNRPPRDIRAIVIGDKVVAAIYRYSMNDEWKTNMALGGRAEICPITNEMEDICIKATNAVAGNIVGVDLMESKEHGLMVHEINNTTEFRNTVSTTGVDIAGLMVDFSSKLK